jgi:hypothetical protein
MNAAYDNKQVLKAYAQFAIDLGRLPARGDLKLRRRADPSFPSSGVFDRLGTKLSLIRQLAEFCRSTGGFDPVISWCDEQLQQPAADGEQNTSTHEDSLGYVYLVKHGSRREYKIGRTTNALRREGEIAIELPEKVQPVHRIMTDDPAGIEAYWHKRFDAKRKNGEWFELSADDVSAFKRRKFM